MAQPVTSQPGVHTTVVIQQGGTIQMRDWNSGLFSCFDDIGTCKFDKNLRLYFVLQHIPWRG